MDEVKRNRIEAANEYWSNDLNGQQEWFSKKSSLAKKKYRMIGALIIVLSAIISFIQLFSPGPSLVSIVTTLLGLLVIVLKNIEGIYMLDETWISYRSVSENMKREKRLYINLAGDYKGINDEKSAYTKFVENTENIIQKEHETWKTTLEQPSQPINEKAMTDD